MSLFKKKKSNKGKRKHTTGKNKAHTGSVYRQK